MQRIVMNMAAYRGLPEHMRRVVDGRPQVLLSVGWCPVVCDSTQKPGR
jgi:hypothetical protein